MQHDGGAAGGIGGEGADEDPFVSLLGEMRDATQRMAETVEANTAELAKLVASQDALTLCLHRLTGLATADQLNAGIGVVLLQKLFPEKLSDETLMTAASHMMARYRGSRQLEILANIEKTVDEILERRRQMAEARKETQADHQHEQADESVHSAAATHAKAEERERQREQAQWGDRDRRR